MTAAKLENNKEVASMLDRIAQLLEAKEANSFRIRSYQHAADTIRELAKPVREIYRQGGEQALKELPGIGDALAGTMEEMLETGRSSQLDRLEGELSPVDLFKQVPGIGSALAERIESKLDIETLEDLELAAHDGRLSTVQGFGKQKVENVRVSLAGMLSQSAARRAVSRYEGGPGAVQTPPIAVLLDIDRMYRRKAEMGELRKIAPKRFNPDDEAWLPIMEIKRDGWMFTSLYSNTKRAHELNKTHDWVVIYYEREGHKGQVTVVTETSGSLEGKRVVRGHEQACKEYYRQRAD